MLSEFLNQKWNHFFNILDFNNNNKITEEDFLAIAENLAILWGYRIGSPEYNQVIERGRGSWRTFIDILPKDVVLEVTRKEFLLLVEELVSSKTDNSLVAFVAGFVEEIFKYFDLNRDQFISVEEFIDLFMAFHIEVRYSGKAFTKLDLNGDELLSKSELQIAVGQYFISEDKEDRGNWLFGFWNTGR